MLQMTLSIFTCSVQFSLQHDVIIFSSEESFSCIQSLRVYKVLNIAYNCLSL